MTHRLLVGNWNEPFLLVACMGNVFQRVGLTEGASLCYAAVSRSGARLRVFATASGDPIAQMAKRFLTWAHEGFDQRFGLSVIEAHALYSIAEMHVRAGHGRQGQNINAMIRRWLLVDIIDPGLPVEDGHFRNPPRKEVKPRRYPPRDVRHAIDAHLLAFEPGHARGYFQSWKEAQEWRIP